MVIVLLLLFILIFPILNFQNVDSIFPHIRSNVAENVKKPEYHFVVIVQNTDDFFWQAVKKGVVEAADEMNIAVEYNGPHFTNIEEQLRYLDIAIASRVDGIITHVLDEKQFTPLINKAVEMNIPVVTIESDAKDSKRLSFVGTNSFQLGFEGGKMIAEATGGKAKAAVIFNSYSSEEGNVMQNLRLSGFKDAVKSFPDIEIITVKTSRMGIFSAEELTQDILTTYPEVNSIYCVSSKDTLGASQVVVDYNRVGDVAIVGYGDLPEILDYVEKGVIYGTVVSSPFNIGYESVKAMVELKKQKRTSSYVDTGVHSITSKNIDDFKKITDKKKGSYTEE